MTRTVIPEDFERADRWTATYFSQGRSICKAHNRFRNSGYKRKLDKKKGKEGKTQRLPSVYCTPDVKRLQLIQLADAPRDEMKQATAVQNALAAGDPLPIPAPPPVEKPDEEVKTSKSTTQTVLPGSSEQTNPHIGPSMYNN